MSKLEKAIRRASVSREKLGRQRKGSDMADGAMIDENSDTLNQLPVPYALKAGRKHKPPAKMLEQHRIITDGYSDQALTNYKMLRTRVLQLMNNNAWSTLAVTAPHDGAGKSLTAINLAITLASQGDHQIFLLDLDMRNPSIAEYFGLPREEIIGLARYLDDDIDLQEILWDVGVDNLVVLANRDRVSDSSERITSKKMQQLIHILKNASPKSIVIVDLPPILTADDPVAISPYIDGFLMVVSEGETPRDVLAHAIDLLHNANFLGLVLNKSGRR